MSALDRGRRRQRVFARHDSAEPGLDAAAAGVGVVPVFQPIVSLIDSTTVGFEALARWPGLPACSPARVFERASDMGTADELDRHCIDAAIGTALRSRLSRDTLLCVNAEPATAYTGRADNAVLANGHDELTVMFEITERKPLAHPHLLLQKVSALRSDGFALALDDVGAHPDSLALLDVVMPEMIKLDLTLVQMLPNGVQARTLAAVLAHHERTGAVIVAEGIETGEHLEQALAIGATLGQGYLFGRPGPLDGDAASVWLPAPRLERQEYEMVSPFEIAAGTSSVRTARRGILIGLTHHIESQAAYAVDAPMVLTALQHEENFTETVRDVYRELAGSCALVAVFGAGMPTDVGSGVRGVGLNDTDPLCAEWTVVVLGPHHAAALIAREQSDNVERQRDDLDRRFDFVITYDRGLVARVARNLLNRMP